MKKKLRPCTLIEDRSCVLSKELLGHSYPRCIRKLFFLIKQGKAGSVDLQRTFRADLLSTKKVKQPFLQKFLKKFFKYNNQEGTKNLEREEEYAESPLLEVEREHDRKFLKELTGHRSLLLDAMWKDSISQTSIIRGEAIDAPDLRLHVPIEAISLFTLHWFRSHATNAVKTIPREVSSKKLLSIIQAQIATRTDARTSLAIQHVSRKLLDKVYSSLGSAFLHLRTVSFKYGDIHYKDVSLNLSAFEAIKGLLWLDYMDEGLPIGSEGCEIKLKHGDPLMRQFCLQASMGIISILSSPISSDLLANSVLDLFKHLVSEEIILRLRKRSLEGWQDISLELLNEMSGSQIRPWMQKQAGKVALFLSEAVLWTSSFEMNYSSSCVSWLKNALLPKESLEETIVPFIVFMHLIQEYFPATMDILHLEQVEYGIYSFLLHGASDRSATSDWLLHVWVKEIVRKCSPMTRLAHWIRDIAEESNLQSGILPHEISRRFLPFALGFGIFHGNESFRAYVLSETSVLVRTLRTLPFREKDPFCFSGMGLLSRAIELVQSLMETFFLFFEDDHFVMLREKVGEYEYVDETKYAQGDLTCISQKSLHFYQKLRRFVHNEPLTLRDIENIIKEEPIYRAVVEQEIYSSHIDNYTSNYGN